MPKLRFSEQFQDSIQKKPLTAISCGLKTKAANQPEKKQSTISSCPQDEMKYARRYSLTMITKISS